VGLSGALWVGTGGAPHAKKALAQGLDAGEVTGPVVAGTQTKGAPHLPEPERAGRETTSATVAEHDEELGPEDLREAHQLLSAGDCEGAARKYLQIARTSGRSENPPSEGDDLPLATRGQLNWEEFAKNARRWCSRVAPEESRR
jgi:hypothetical protein